MTLVDITVWTGKTLQGIIFNKLNKQLQAINMCLESEKSDFSSLGLRLFVLANSKNQSKAYRHNSNSKCSQHAGFLYIHVLY